jgi:hypothetical protein
MTRNGTVVTQRLLKSFAALVERSGLAKKIYDRPLTVRGCQAAA